MLGRTMPWRTEDEALLQRLEDEILVERLWGFFVGAGSGCEPVTPSSAPHPRAAGLIAELRRLPGGAEVVAGALRTSAQGGDVAGLARFVDGLVMKDCSPQLLHHLALFHSKAAVALEHLDPDSAATAWVRALAAWLALGEERAYLARLEDAVLRPGDAPEAVGVSLPSRGPLELVADVARRAEATARDLGLAGRAALLALARTDEAARIAGASDTTAKRTRVFAQRQRNAAIEAALAVIGEGLDEANVRGELASSGRILLLRAIAVWTWTSNDEAVEHFVVDRIDKIGWELYRARNWDSLRYLLDPFRPMFDSLARRIERDRDRSQIAYAAGCAQMFVFLAEVERVLEPKLESAERAVRICPTHRNGRLVLASALCDQAMHLMRTMVLFAPKKEVERVEALLERARSLYPETSSLAEATGMLDRVKTGKITV
jgi:hypothetical protein